MSESKVCTKCGEEKPLSEFYKSNRNLDGRMSWCKILLFGSQSEGVFEKYGERATEK